MPERKGDRAHQTEERCRVIPAQRFSHVQVGEAGEDDEGDRFLDDLEPYQAKVTKTFETSSSATVAMRRV